MTESLMKLQEKTNINSTKMFQPILEGIKQEIKKLKGENYLNLQFKNIVFKELIEKIKKSVETIKNGEVIVKTKLVTRLTDPYIPISKL